MYNKNCDKAPKKLKIRWERRWKCYARKLAKEPSP
jgi:hypothetical protein